MLAPRPTSTPDWARSDGRPSPTDSIPRAVSTSMLNALGAEILPASPQLGALQIEKVRPKAIGDRFGG